MADSMVNFKHRLASYFERIGGTEVSHLRSLLETLPRAYATPEAQDTLMRFISDRCGIDEAEAAEELDYVTARLERERRNERFERLLEPWNAEQLEWSLRAYFADVDASQLASVSALVTFYRGREIALIRELELQYRAPLLLCRDDDDAREEATSLEIAAAATLDNNNNSNVNLTADSGAGGSDKSASSSAVAAGGSSQTLQTGNGGASSDADDRNAAAAVASRRRASVAGAPATTPSVNHVTVAHHDGSGNNKNSGSAPGASAAANAAAATGRGAMGGGSATSGTVDADAQQQQQQQHMLQRNMQQQQFNSKHGSSHMQLLRIRQMGALTVSELHQFELEILRFLLEIRSELQQRVFAATQQQQQQPPHASPPSSSNAKQRTPAPTSKAAAVATSPMASPANRGAADNKDADKKKKAVAAGETATKPAAAPAPSSPAPPQPTTDSETVAATVTAMSRELAALPRKRLARVERLMQHVPLIARAVTPMFKSQLLLYLGFFCSLRVEARKVMLKRLAGANHDAPLKADENLQRRVAAVFASEADSRGEIVLGERRARARFGPLFCRERLQRLAESLCEAEEADRADVDFSEMCVSSVARAKMRSLLFLERCHVELNA